jgi:hypothetical protein
MARCAACNRIIKASVKRIRSNTGKIITIDETLCSYCRSTVRWSLSDMYVPYIDNVKDYL